MWIIVPLFTFSMLLIFLVTLSVAHTAVFLEKRAEVVAQKEDTVVGITAKILDEGMESAMREASAGIEVVGGQLQVTGSKVKAFSITINSHNGNTEKRS